MNMHLFFTLFHQLYHPLNNPTPLPKRETLELKIIWELYFWESLWISPNVIIKNTSKLIDHYTRKSNGAWMQWPCKLGAQIIACLARIFSNTLLSCTWLTAWYTKVFSAIVPLLIDGPNYLYTMNCLSSRSHVQHCTFAINRRRGANRN